MYHSKSEILQHLLIKCLCSLKACASLAHAAHEVLKLLACVKSALEEVQHVPHSCSPI